MDFASTPAAISVLIATVSISLYVLYKNHALGEKMVLHPYTLIREKKYYMLISSGLIHGDLPHLLFNMFSFYFFAFSLERVAGSMNFLIIYFLSMIIADIPTIIRNKDNYNYGSLGASGAVSGVVFASILFNPLGKIFILPFPFPIPTPIYAILYLVYCQMAARNAQDNINHDAHFWGAVAGLLITIFLIPQSLQYFIDTLIG